MTANYKEMTKEQMRAHMKAFMKRMEKEARDWEAEDNRRMKESLKQKLERDRKNSKIEKIDQPSASDLGHIRASARGDSLLALLSRLAFLRSLLRSGRAAS